MLARILQEAGHVVGKCTTEGVYLRGQKVWEGDASGFKGAGWILTEPGITAAALETARGDLLNRGLFMKSADVAAMTNIQREHIGERGIETPEQMAALKKRVLDVASRAVVLNADDVHCLNVASAYPTERTILFSANATSDPIVRHLKAGGRAIAVDRSSAPGRILAFHGGETEEIIAVKEMPASLDGKLAINVMNAMAAAGLALGMGVSTSDIANGLRNFQLDAVDSPGRFTLLEDYPVTILASYGSNPAAILATLPAIASLPHSGTRFCLVTAPDNRPDDHFSSMAEGLAGHFDWYIIFEMKNFIRRHDSGWVPDLLEGHLRTEGVPQERIVKPGSLQEAVDFVLRHGTSDDLMVVLGAAMYELDKAIEGKRFRTGLDL